MSDTFKLFRLQTADLALQKVANRLAEIDAVLAQDQAVQQAQARCLEAEDALAAQRKALHRLEAEAAELRVKQELNHAALYGGRVRNPKELQDLQAEAGVLARHQSGLDDRQLEAMLALEVGEADLNAARASLVQAQSEAASRNALLRGEANGLQRDLARLAGERDAVRAALEAGDLAIYDALKLRRRGVAVARVERGTCTACGTTLSASKLHETRSPDQLTRCDGCGRILYGG
jgi:predicted  nucleic acid-binding Zn-ribbon protein